VRLCGCSRDVRPDHLPKHHCDIFRRMVGNGRTSAIYEKVLSARIIALDETTTRTNVTIQLDWGDHVGPRCAVQDRSENAGVAARLLGDHSPRYECTTAV
jgi:hypothetical protein